MEIKCLDTNISGSDHTKNLEQKLYLEPLLTLGELQSGTFALNQLDMHSKGPKIRHVGISNGGIYCHEHVIQT